MNRSTIDGRITLLREHLKKNKLDGVFILKESNVRYLSGFTSGDSYLFITKDHSIFITDSRYTEQAAREVNGYEIVKWRAPNAGLPETLKMLCDRYKIKRVGFEKRVINVELYESFKAVLEDVEFLSADGLTEDLRRIKSPEEIDFIRNAAKIADRAFHEILNFLKPGVTEKDVERELHYLIQKLGADDIGFPLIIASGLNTSMPHAVPSDKVIEKGDFVTFDMGALYQGYRSDMTRTIVMGNATPRQKEVYELVLRSQEASVSTVRAGVDGKLPHAVAREILEKSGVEGIFEYGVGHGVGLDIHEDPFMSPRCPHTLEIGNIVTIEPGVYIPGWGGIRIEDTVVVTDRGNQILTLSPKELIEV